MSITKTPEEIFELALEIHNEKVGELWGADPECWHEVVSSNGGGIECIKCKGWFCF